MTNSKTEDESKSSQRNIHIEDDLIHIKRFKGIRGRLELYIHNSELKQWLKNVEIMLPQEEGEEAKRLTKKVLFYDIEYGILIQHVCRYLYLGMGKTSVSKISEFLGGIETSLAEFAKNPTDPDLAWEEAYGKTSQKVKQIIANEFGQ